MTEVPILYRDDDVVVVHKPARLAVHRNEWSEPDESFLLQRVRDRVGQRVNLVHRLDRATSGVLVCALSPEVTQTLGAAFAERRVEKRYLAVVRGHPADAWAVDRALRKPGGDRAEQTAETAFETAHRATIDMAVGRYATARYAVVWAHPRTGRHHQIRRHLSGADHPIVGDVAHGDRHHNQAFRGRFGVGRLLLHAAALTFPHPRSGELITARAPLDSAFRAALVALGAPGNLLEIGTGT